MSKIDEKHTPASATLIKTIQAPFYLSFYLLGGLGAIMDVPNWKKNFSTGNKNKCFEGFGNDHYSILGIDLKLDKNTTLIDAPNCITDPSGDVISLTFGITDPAYKKEEGSSIVSQHLITRARNILNDQQVDDAIRMLSSKPVMQVLEIKNSKNPRFSVISYEINNISQDNDTTCKVFTSLIKDYHAPNNPSGISHLVQRDFYKTCYLKDRKMFIISAISFRVTPKISKDLTQNQMLQKLNQVLKSFTFDDGKLLSEIIKL